MRRDEDYLRQLLFEFESDKDAFKYVFMTLNPPVEDQKRWLHVQILSDYGYLANISSKDTGSSHAFRLTAAGYDYISAIRDEGIWNRTKEAVAETGGNATLDIMKQIATSFLKKKISEQTGLEL